MLKSIPLPLELRNKRLTNPGGHSQTPRAKKTQKITNVFKKIEINCKNKYKFACLFRVPKDIALKTVIKKQFFLAKILYELLQKSILDGYNK